MSSAPGAARRPRVSLVMIVRDAAQLIAPALSSAVGLADEIIVVDTGSTDNTAATARQLGANVVCEPWPDDFALARNRAASYATGDWILWLDAGEQLAGGAAAELRQFIDSQAAINKAYMLLVTVPPAADQISGEQVGRVRLVANRKELYFEGRVRERIEPSIERAGLSIEGLPWRIERGYGEHDVAVKLRRAQRDLKLIELEIKELGQEPHQLVGLGEALSNLGDYARAAAAFRQAIGAAAAGSSLMREAYYGLMTAGDAQGADRWVQLGICLEALGVFPLDPQLLCAMGGYLQAQGRLELAARAYETAIDQGQIDPWLWHVRDIGEIAAVCLGMVHQLENDDEQSRVVLERAAERWPDSHRVRRQLVDLHVKHDRRREALAEFDRLVSEPGERELMRSAVRGACLAAKQDWAAALPYLQSAYAGGCRDPFCLRWLAVTLLAESHIEAAEPILAAWKAVEPRNTELHKYLEALCPATPLAAADPAQHLRVDRPQMQPAQRATQTVGRPISSLLDRPI